MTAHSTQSSKVAVVGGGLAGLAAGCALADAGFQVMLFERRPYLGGRASSYEHPGTAEIVDNCQHVLLGCCTNLVEFYKRLGVENKIRWYDRLTFLEPGGQASTISPSVLPAPFHTAPSFLRAGCLNLRDKIAISAAMAALARALPPDNGESFLTWLRGHRQTERAIERFWKTILVSALNEDLDRMLVPYAAQVVRESFLKSAEAGRMGVPTVPLTELYSAAGDYIQARGGEVCLRSSVECFRADPAGGRLYIAGKEVSFEFVVFAVPFDALLRMLPQVMEAEALRKKLHAFETSPITGIHLWFDREITELEHAVLLDRTIQWMFHKSKLLRQAGRPPDSRRGAGATVESAEGHGFSQREAGATVESAGGHGFSRAASGPAQGGALAPEGSYVELVVSSSKALVEKSKAEITELALKELYEFFPAARDAKLLKSTVIKEVNATFSPRPGIDAYRPKSETAWPRVFLAGDWIATGWPATMEGAVRSGYMAAEAVARGSGVNDARFLSPDLPATGLMQLFGDA
jgi:squalene-associated FAD-dependent desaturase